MEKMRIDRIKLLIELEKKGMSQKRLAELAGTSRTTVNNIRNGKTCTNDIGNRIAEALNVNLNEILETENR